VHSAPARCPVFPPRVVGAQQLAKRAKVRDQGAPTSTAEWPLMPSQQQARSSASESACGRVRQFLPRRSDSGQIADGQRTGWRLPGWQPHQRRLGHASECGGFEAVDSGAVGAGWMLEDAFAANSWS